ncbi:hypothetical protein HUT06_28840 [Actinomadura sp. NAK00032]|uniref:hypothetical protein n=1 Tax=Actinomadura sp. NAK00032 TaxID=2742128 RepID=UPI0015920AC1|nr:hypothetical protein [Actinomadura sp. NAK00032]QKW37521.1 hypothetical protein HUT06_28840 [Actinomadura sp. NAK00032]
MPSAEQAHGIRKIPAQLRYRHKPATFRIVTLQPAIAMPGYYMSHTPDNSKHSKKWRCLDRPPAPGGQG